MWAGLPPLSLARDPDVAVARVFDLFADLRPLGEGQTVCDEKEHQATPVTLSTGVGVRDAMPCHPSPSSGKRTMLVDAPSSRDVHVPM